MKLKLGEKGKDSKIAKWKPFPASHVLSKQVINWGILARKFSSIFIGEGWEIFIIQER